MKQAVESRTPPKSTRYALLSLIGLVLLSCFWLASSANAQNSEQVDCYNVPSVSGRNAADLEQKKQTTVDEMKGWMQGQLSSGKTQFVSVPMGNGVVCSW